MPSVDYSQGKIIDKMLAYIEAKAKKIAHARANPHLYPKATVDKLKDVTQDKKLPFTTAEGICSGLCKSWGYYKRIGKEDIFDENINTILAWDSDAFEKNTQMDDPDLEQIISNIIFIHYEAALREPGVLQSDMDASINIVSGSLPEVAPAEFSFTFVFNKKTLSELLGKIIAPGKMIRIENGFHAIEIAFDGSTYEFFDPESAKKKLRLYSVKDIATNVFKSLTKFSGATSHTAMRIFINDLVGVKKRTDYDQITQETLAELQVPSYKKHVIKDRLIYNLAIRYNDYQLADLLFANGYVYIPWDYDEHSELNLAIVDEDYKKFKYVLNHGYPIDYYNPDSNGVSALGKAIALKRAKMIYMLLSAGADPNMIPLAGWSVVGLLHHFYPQALILLLAFGLHLSTEELSRVKKKFFNYKEYFKLAVALNRKILSIPDTFILERADIDQAIKFMRHATLIRELDLPPESIKIMYKGKEYESIEAINEIAKFFHTKNDVPTFNAYEELYELLRPFHLATTQSNLERELLESLKAIQVLLSKPHEYSADDMQNLNIFVANIAELKEQFADSPILQKELSAAQKQIVACLKRQHIAIEPETHRHAMLFLSNLHPSHYLTVPEYETILPALKPLF